jgi:3-oxoacyl-[acyl-carrier protein] reductase
MEPMPRNIIITGAGSGVGAAVAKTFAEDGDRVHLVDLSAERLTAVAETLPKGRVETHAVDVTDREATQAVVERVVTDHGGVDVLASCAGVFDACASILDTTPDLWDKVLGINLTGTYNVVRPVAQAMVAQKSGRIVLIGSIAAQRAMPDGVAYCAAKAGLEGMTRRLAFDLGQYGITANLIAPGVVRTGIRATSSEILGESTPDTNVGVGTDQSLMDQLIPLRRGGTPEEIAATVKFLASEGAGYMSGDVLHVDGGWIAS